MLRRTLQIGMRHEGSTIVGPYEIGAVPGHLISAHCPPAVGADIRIRWKLSNGKPAAYSPDGWYSLCELIASPCEALSRIGSC